MYETIKWHNWKSDKGNKKAWKRSIQIVTRIKMKT